MFMILLSSGLLILLLIVLRPFTRKRVSPIVQYSLWLLVALRLLLPFQFGSSALSLENLFPKDTPHRISEQQIADTMVPQEQLPTPSYTPIMQESAPLEMDPPVSATPSQTPEILPTAPADTSAVPSPTAPTAAFPLTTEQILYSIWFVGSLTMAGWFLTVNIRFQRKAKKNAQKLDIPQFPLSVYETHCVPSPCLVGLFRPQVFLLPQEDSHQKIHILTHEYTHYRHKDHIWSFLRGLCLCVYWFNPLVWVAAYLSKEDCELACDYSAINALGEEERLPYGKTLLDTLVQANRPGNLLRSATTMGGGKKQIRTRLESIVSKPKKFLWALICLLLVVALSVGCTFTGSRGTPQDPTEENTATTAPATEDSSMETTSAEDVADPTKDPQMINPAGVALLDGWFGEVVTVDKAGGYAIPHLFLETEYGEQVNQEILDRFGMIAEGDRSQYTGLTYNWYLTVLEHFDPSPQVLVLDITATTVQGTTEKLTYYVDLAYGAELSAKGYASNIQYRVSRELVQELYDEFANTGAISFTSEDRDVYLENLTRSYQEATFALTEQGTLAITIPYITLDGSIRDIPMSCEPTESISVNAFHEPDVIEFYTYTSKNGTENTIPLILLESVYAKKLNAYILNEYLTLQPDHLTYTEAIHGEILSFSMKAEDPNTYDLMCLAENLFLDGSSAPTAEAVLSQGKGSMTYEEYTEKARVLFPSYFFDLFPGITEQFPNDKMVLQQVKRSGSSPNIALSTPYLDEDGNVWTYAYIYQIAGSSHTAHLIPITTGKVNEEYLAFAKENNLFQGPAAVLTAYLKALYGEGDYELIYTAGNAYPEYVDGNIMAESLSDHIYIRLHRKFEPTMTPQDLQDISELKAAADLLGVSEVIYLLDPNGEVFPESVVRRMYIVESSTFTGPIKEYVELIWDVSTNEVHILVYWSAP